MTLPFKIKIVQKTSYFFSTSIINCLSLIVLMPHLLFIRKVKCQNIRHTQGMFHIPDPMQIHIIKLGRICLSSFEFRYFKS